MRLWDANGKTMFVGSVNVGTILLIVLIVSLIGALPAWPHSKNWGYYPSGGVDIGRFRPVAVGLFHHGGRSFPLVLEEGRLSAKP